MIGQISHLGVVPMSDAKLAPVPLPEVKREALRDWLIRQGANPAEVDDLIQSVRLPSRQRQCLAVNYLRHQALDYDQRREALKRDGTLKEALPTLRAEVYTTIATHYPALAAECERQAKRRGLTLTLCEKRHGPQRGGRELVGASP
jgi:hypothetical protein